MRIETQINQLSILFALPILLGAFFMLPLTSAALTWAIQPISDNNAQDGIIALDGDNIPHIVYVDIQNNTPFMMYASWNGSKWDAQTVTTNCSPVGFALDSYSNPHILCRFNDAGLVYAIWNGSNWTFQTIDKDGLTGSLALDSSGNPRVAYVANNWPTNAFAIKYATNEGSGWSIQTLESSQNILGYPYLVLDSNDNPQIMYEEDAYSHSIQTLSTIKYAVRNNVSDAWFFPITLKNVTLGTMALDSNGYPHFTCLEGLYGGALAYVSWNGTVWNTQPIANLTLYTYSCLVLGSHNNPHIAYVDQTGDLTYARWNGTGWGIQTVNGSKATVSQSMVLDSYGNPHICYQAGYVNFGSLFYATASEPAINPISTGTTSTEAQMPFIILAIVILAAATISALVYRSCKRKV